MTAKDRARVHRLLRKWQRRLLLQAWSIDDVTFSDEHHPKINGRTYYLTVVPDARYLRFSIVVWMDFWSLDPIQQEQWLEHELMHGPVAPLAELAMRAVRRKQVIEQDVEAAEETLVEHYARALWKAYN